MRKPPTQKQLDRLEKYVVLPLGYLALATVRLWGPIYYWNKRRKRAKL